MFVRANSQTVARRCPVILTKARNIFSSKPSLRHKLWLPKLHRKRVLVRDAGEVGSVSRLPGFRMSAVKDAQSHVSWAFDFYALTAYVFCFTFGRNPGHLASFPNPPSSDRASQFLAMVTRSSEAPARNPLCSSGRPLTSADGHIPRIAAPLKGSFWVLLLSIQFLFQDFLWLGLGLLI